MLYVVVKPKDCPKMWFYKYLWFYRKYFFQLYMLTVYNLRNIRFGQLINTFKAIVFCILYLPKTIMIEYNTTFKDKFNKYLKYSYS